MHAFPAHTSVRMYVCIYVSVYVGVRVLVFRRKFS